MEVLEKGMAVQLLLKGPINHTATSFESVGLISLLDKSELAAEWNEVAEELFPEGTGPQPGDNRRFTKNDQVRIRELLDAAKERIREEFSPPQAAQRKIESRLDCLAKKASQAGAYDWKRLFVTAVVGLAADLGFGGTVPEALINLFKNLFTEFISQRLSLGDANRNG